MPINCTHCLVYLLDDGTRVPGMQRVLGMQRVMGMQRVLGM